MQDFPPRIATFFSGADDAPTPDPDTRSPAAFLRWMLRQQWQVIALSTLACLLWLMPLTFGPYIFGRAVDEGILGGLAQRPARVGGGDARRGPGRRRLRRRLPHPGRAQLADQPLRHDPDGHPQDRPDGPRAAAPLAHRRDPQRLVERLRRVRRADRDPGALRRAAGLLPDRRRHRAVDVVAARRASCSSPRPCCSGPRCRCCDRCTGASRSSAAATPSSPRWPPTSWPDSASCAGSAARRRSAATTPTSPSRPAGQASPRASGSRRSRPSGVLFSGVFLVTLVWLGTRQVNAGELSVGQLVELPRLRPLHGRPDPHLLRARPEVHPGAGERPPGDRDLRAAAAVARAGRPAAARRAPRDRRRAQRLHRRTPAG